MDRHVMEKDDVLERYDVPSGSCKDMTRASLARHSPLTPVNPGTHLQQSLCMPRSTNKAVNRPPRAYDLISSANCLGDLC
jgi:hypothetical protein